MESRPHLRFADEHRKHSLTGGTLLGPGKIPVPPLVFLEEGKYLVSMAYIGTDLCGHVGIVHGGLLATLCDEGLARCGFSALPNKIGVTASLTINYRNPAPAGSFVVLKAETIKAEGRKVWVKGRIELLSETEESGKVLVEADGLFIEPRYAKVHLSPTLVCYQVLTQPSLCQRSSKTRPNRRLPETQIGLEAQIPCVLGKSPSPFNPGDNSACRCFPTSWLSFSLWSCSSDVKALSPSL